jgi:hypothetical protein
MVEKALMAVDEQSAVVSWMVKPTILKPISENAEPKPPLELNRRTSCACSTLNIVVSLADGGRFIGLKALNCRHLLLFLLEFVREAVPGQATPVGFATIDNSSR